MAFKKRTTSLFSDFTYRFSGLVPLSPQSAEENHRLDDSTHGDERFRAVALQKVLLIEEAGFQLVVQHLLVEGLGQRSGDGRDEPDPVGGTAAALGVLLPEELHELGVQLVVVDQGDAILVEGVEHCLADD